MLRRPLADTFMGRLNENGGFARGPWTKQEDAKLRSLVALNQPKNWTILAAQLGTRSGKQCRERWLNHLDPVIKKGPWTPEEDAILMNLHRSYGNRWSEIAKHLPGRTDNSLKNRFNSKLKTKMYGSAHSAVASARPASFYQLSAPSHASHMPHVANLQLPGDMPPLSKHSTGTFRIPLRDAATKPAAVSHAAPSVIESKALYSGRERAMASPAVGESAASVSQCQVVTPSSRTAKSHSGSISFAENSVACYEASNVLVRARRNRKRQFFETESDASGIATTELFPGPNSDTPSPAGRELVPENLFGMSWNQLFSPEESIHGDESTPKTFDPIFYPSSLHKSFSGSVESEHIPLQRDTTLGVFPEIPHGIPTLDESLCDQELEDLGKSDGSIKRPKLEMGSDLTSFGMSTCYESDPTTEKLASDLETSLCEGKIERSQLVSPDYRSDAGFFQSAESSKENSMKIPDEASSLFR